MAPPRSRRCSPSLPAVAGVIAMIHVRTAPARQVARLLALGELQRLLEGLVEILFNGRLAEAAAHEVRPQELAEWRGVLGETAHAAQFAGDAAVRIVLEVG